MIGPAESLRESVRLLRAHPVFALSLGTAIVLSLCSACTGLGAVVGPWFVCELYGVQIATGTGTRKARGPQWISAAAIVLGTVLVIAATVWLSAMWFGPNVATADAAEGPLPWPETLRRLSLVIGSTALAVGFIAPFLYAPLILIDRGGRIGGAVVESAWLVARGGVLRHLAIAFVVYGLQVAPAVLSGMIVARTIARAATPIGLALALPLLPLSIPLGQGILTATYLASRHRLASPRAVIARGRPPRRLVALLAIVIVSPIASLVMLGLVSLRPSTPAAGPADAGEVLVDRSLGHPEPGSPTSLAIPETTLALRVRGRELRITAGDGDDVGALPAGWSGAIERVRVVRVGALYHVEIHADDDVAHARIDGAGVRIDDSIRSRLERWVPTWALLVILVAAGVCGGLLVRTLAPMGSLRAAAEPDAADRPLRREDAYRRSWRAGLALLPFALAALVGGLVSIGWL